MRGGVLGGAGGVWERGWEREEGLGGAGGVGKGIGVVQGWKGVRGGADGVGKGLGWCSRLGLCRGCGKRIGVMQKL